MEDQISSVAQVLTGQKKICYCSHLRLFLISNCSKHFTKQFELWLECVKINLDWVINSFRDLKEPVNGLFLFID